MRTQIYIIKDSYDFSNNNYFWFPKKKSRISKKKHELKNFMDRSMITPQEGKGAFEKLNELFYLINLGEIFAQSFHAKKKT